MTIQAILGLSVAGIALVGAAALGERVVARGLGNDRVTVVYWEKWTGPEEREMRKVVDAFNRSQDRITVKYLSISGIDSKTMLATAGGDPPDVAGLWQEQVGQFADANALTDLTQMAREAGLTPDYYIPSFYNALAYRGGLWALPSTPAAIALHVRSDLVPPDVATPETFPKTVEGLDALNARISKKDKNGNLVMAGFLPSNPGWWNWWWPNLYGGSVFHDDRLTVDSPAAVRAFKWIGTYSKLFGSREVTSFQGSLGNFASPQDPFMTGKVATELNGVWKASYINTYKPGLKWFAVPMPYPEGRRDLALHGPTSQDILAIPHGAKHVKEAFEFIRYVERQDVMEGLCLAHGKESPLNKVSEHFYAVHPNPYIRLFDKLARSPNTTGPPVVGILPQIRNEMDVAFQKVNTGEDTPEHALHDAQARLSGQWETYRKQVLGR